MIGMFNSLIKLTDRRTETYENEIRKRLGFEPWKPGRVGRPPKYVCRRPSQGPLAMGCVDSGHMAGPRFSSNQNSLIPVAILRSSGGLEGLTKYALAPN